MRFVKTERIPFALAPFSHRPGFRAAGTIPGYGVFWPVAPGQRPGNFV
jgi:hypothetical protein